jgi:cob(I)alamin adenosyltransferase
MNLVEKPIIAIFYLFLHFNMAFKIYTKTGDKGETSLFGGARLPKSHLRIEAYGTVDELNSHLGLLRDVVTDETLRGHLKQIQDRLFDVGANLAVDTSKKLQVPEIIESDIAFFETEMDKMDEVLEPLRQFILPGGHLAVSYCHVARTVCRRAERNVVALSLTDEVDEILVRYLNRLSDYLFVLARKIAMDLGVKEVTWSKRD